jgi:hypothetical protein
MPSSDEWVSVTNRQTLAERWARRVLARRAGGVGLTLWPLYFAADALRSWFQHDTVFLTLDLMALAMIGVSMWERYGFRQVVDRYESELRRLRPPADPA